MLVHAALTARFARLHLSYVSLHLPVVRLHLPVVRLHLPVAGLNSAVAGLHSAIAGLHSAVAGSHLLNVSWQVSIAVFVFFVNFTFTLPCRTKQRSHLSAHFDIVAGGPTQQKGR